MSPSLDIPIFNLPRELFSGSHPIGTIIKFKFDEETKLYTANFSGGKTILLDELFQLRGEENESAKLFPNDGAFSKTDEVE